MAQDTLFLLLVAVLGVFALRWTLRLVPLVNEFPLKTLIATVLSGLVAGSGFAPYVVDQPLRLLTLIVGPLYVFLPLLLVGLARARRYRVARAVQLALYWTSEGRAAVARLLVQAALQQGDAEAALALIPDRDPLLLAQAHALRQAWDEVLALDLPMRGDRGFLAAAARIQALLALGRDEEAESLLAGMRERWQAEGQSAIGYRSLLLSEARLAAERGDLTAVRSRLGQPLPGVPPYQVLAILARAAERAGDHDAAARLYAQAYSYAPPGMRPSLAEVVQAYGRPLPPSARPTAPAYGTFGLLGVLLLAYGLQLWLDAAAGYVLVSGQRIQASTVASAFLLNLGGVPEAGAWWRYLAYAFVHGNLVHIGFNAWVLFDLGRIYEVRRGWGNLLAAFTIGTAMGAYLTTVAQAGTVVALVGASGGILGIAGALLADVLRGRSSSDRMLTRSLLQWMVLIALLSVAIPNVSLWGHVGGVIGGLLWGFARQGLPSGRLIDKVAGVVGIVLLVAAVAQVGRIVVTYLL